MPVDQSQPVIGDPFSAIKPDLRRLCTIHDLDAGWVDESEDCQALLDRVSVESLRLLEQESLGEGDSRRLQVLIRFSALVASLHQEAASAIVSAQQDRLAEIFHSLASLTHKINNPLTSLIGRTQLMRMTGASDERTTKAMNVVEESARRVAEYVRELALVVKESRERELGE